MKGGAAWKKASEKKELAKALAGTTKKNGEKEERYGGGKLQELIGISTLFDKSS